MTDSEHAEAIRNAIGDLNRAVTMAAKYGISVEYQISEQTLLGSCCVVNHVWGRITKEIG